MSSIGIGLAVEVAALVVIGASYGVYYAGKGIIALVKGGVKLGVEAHDAYVRREERRKEELREELASLRGEMAKEALRRHDEIAAAERAADAAEEKARAEMAASMEAAMAKMEAAGKESEAIIAGMEEYLDASRKSVEAMAKREESAFHRVLEEKCEAMTASVTESVKRDKEELAEKLAAVESKLEGRKEVLNAYARKTLDECDELIRFMEAHYDCRELAESDYSSVCAARAALASCISEGDVAAYNAGSLAQKVRLLHVTLERNAALNERMRSDIERALAELSAAVSASETLLDKDAPEGVAYYVNKDRDSDFWSRGELSTLWSEAAALREKMEDFHFGDYSMAQAWLIQAGRLRDQIVRSYMRARQHVACMLVSEDTLQHLEDSMFATGWNPEGDAQYVRVDPTSGRYVESGDPRDDIAMRFVNDRGDQCMMVLTFRYNPATGKYEQQIIRFNHEVDEPDEDERKRLDADFNAEFESRSGVNAGVHCDMSTIGQKADV